MTCKNFWKTSATPKWEQGRKKETNNEKNKNLDGKTKTLAKRKGLPEPGAGGGGLDWFGWAAGSAGEAGTC